MFTNFLGAEVAERIAFSGVRTNLFSYLTGPLGQSTATAAVNVNVLVGTAYLSPLLGAFVGDLFLGQFWAIVGASLFYVLVSRYKHITYYERNFIH